MNPKRNRYTRRPTPDAKTQEGAQARRTRARQWRALARIADRAARVMKRR